MYVCICMYIYIYIYTHVFMYTHIYVDWIQSLQKGCFLYIGLYRFIFEKVNIHLFLNIHFLVGLKK